MAKPRQAFAGAAAPDRTTAGAVASAVPAGAKAAGPPAGPPQPKQLLRAAKDDNVVRVLELLDLGLDIEHKGMWGNTPLLCACAYGCPGAADALVKRGADCTVRNDDGATPLLLACMEGLDAAALGMLAREDVTMWPPAATVYNQVVDSSEAQTPLRVFAGRLGSHHADVERRRMARARPAADEVDALASPQGVVVVVDEQAVVVVPPMPAADDAQAQLDEVSADLETPPRRLQLPEEPRRHARPAPLQELEVQTAWPRQRLQPDVQPWVRVLHLQAALLGSAPCDAPPRRRGTGILARLRLWPGHCHAEAGCLAQRLVGLVPTLTAVVASRATTAVTAPAACVGVAAVTSTACVGVAAVAREPRQGEPVPVVVAVAAAVVYTTKVACQCPALLVRPHLVPQSLSQPPTPPLPEPPTPPPSRRPLRRRQRRRQTPHRPTRDAQGARGPSRRLLCGPLRAPPRGPLPAPLRGPLHSCCIALPQQGGGAGPQKPILSSALRHQAPLLLPVTSRPAQHDQRGRRRGHRRIT